MAEAEGWPWEEKISAITKKQGLFSKSFYWQIIRNAPNLGRNVIVTLTMTREKLPGKAGSANGIPSLVLRVKLSRKSPAFAGRAVCEVSCWLVLRTTSKLELASREPSQTDQAGSKHAKRARLGDDGDRGRAEADVLRYAAAESVPRAKVNGDATETRVAAFNPG